MSGGVVPADEIVLREQQPQSNTQPKSQLHRGNILSFQQLNALAVAIVLSATGMVAIESFAFVLFSFFYMYFLSKTAFPTINRSQNHPVFDDSSRLLSVYSFVGAVFGLFLPVAYIFEGIIEGDKEGIKAATPHVFLLASQLFLEGVAYSDLFSLPMRVLVPVVYNSARIFSLMEWLRSEISKVEVEEFGGSSRRVVMGRVLAVANLVYWSFNLFGFLLPVYVPLAFKRYYSDEKNIKD
ncbi:hypothetical protein Hdeb2414_s0331g00869721 [Helianthus debilis subsp. tardiflorus]